MDGKSLLDLIQQRRAILGELLESSRLQGEAIEHGRMVELMDLLEAKHRPIRRLHSVSVQLRELLADSAAATRRWQSEQQRARCRAEHQECEQLMAELLSLEAECERSLCQHRDQTGTELRQADSARRAASHYAASSQPVSRDGQLDLSSD